MTRPTDGPDPEDGDKALVQRAGVDGRPGAAVEADWALCLQRLRLRPPDDALERAEVEATQAAAGRALYAMARLPSGPPGAFWTALRALGHEAVEPAVVDIVARAMAFAPDVSADEALAIARRTTYHDDWLVARRALLDRSDLPVAVVVVLVSQAPVLEQCELLLHSRIANDEVVYGAVTEHVEYEWSFRTARLHAAMSLAPLPSAAAFLAVLRAVAERKPDEALSILAEYGPICYPEMMARGGIPNDLFAPAVLASAFADPSRSRVALLAVLAALAPSLMAPRQ